MRVVRRRARFAAPLMVFVFSVQPTAAATKRAGPVPPSLHGVWAVESKDCDNPNGESRLVVDDRTFLFFVTAYDVKRIEKRRDGSWRASGTRADEGEAGKTRAAITVKLMSPDRIKVMGSGAEDQDYDRCKGRSPALGGPLRG
jgi:hypothetical protein